MITYNNQNTKFVFWSRLTIYSVFLFVFLVALLHIIKPELDPNWRMISEYAMGKNGWMMISAFILWALGWSALAIAIRPQVSTLSGKLGLIALWISALGCLLAGVFTTDPVTINKEDITTSGMLHSFGGTLGMAMPLAVILISLALYKNPHWKGYKSVILRASLLALFGFLVSFISLAILLSQSNGIFSPDTPVGFSMRFEALGYCVWMIVIALGTFRLKLTKK